MGILEDLLASATAGQGIDRPDTGNVGMRGREQPQAGGSGGGIGSVMTSLLPVILSMLANRDGSSQQVGMGGGGLGGVLNQALGGGGAGGLGGLLEQMARAGYGDQARSWVGTGRNMPIPPDAMGQIFGSSGVAEIARRAGVDQADASRGLAELLPEVVDRVTPGGQVPDLDALSTSVSDLSRRLGLA